MFYEVKQFNGRQEMLMDRFNQIAEARTFIKTKLDNDYLLKRRITYRLYEDEELLEEWTPEKWQEIKDQQTTETGSSKQSSGVTFNPTPFAAAPRPGGVPQSGLKEVDSSKKEDK